MPFLIAVLLFSNSLLRAQLGKDLTDELRVFCRKDLKCAAQKSRAYAECRSDEACKLDFYDKLRREILNRDFQEVAEERCQETSFIDQECVKKLRARFNRCDKMSCQRRVIEKIREQRRR